MPYSCFYDHVINKAKKFTSDTSKRVKFFKNLFAKAVT